MRLRFTPRATANLIEIADYVNDRSPAAARNVRAAILASLETLLLFPKAGRRQRAEGVRKYAVRKYRYLIYYTVDTAADELVILSVKHPARRREQEDA